MLSQRVISKPFRLHWAGWETDSVQLQQAGWQLSAEQDYNRDTIRILFRHNDFKIYGLTKVDRFDYQRFWMDQSFERMGSPTLEVRFMCAELRVNINDNLAAFVAVDAYPQYVEREIKKIEDFGIFATPLIRTEEIIVDPNNVAAMLKRIKEIQAPIQTVIRESNRRRDLRQPIQRQVFHAQILSIA